MLDASIIMFSRSLTKDYRWIYSADFINEASRNEILGDYKEFENNKEEFLKNRHLIIRHINKGVFVYKFIETKDKDQNSRKIYALLGCMFVENEIMRILFKYIIAYLYEEFDVWLEKYQKNIPEKKEAYVEKINLDIDCVIEYGRTNNNIVKLLENNIQRFISQCISEDFIIIQGSVRIISSGSINRFLMGQENIDSYVKNEMTLFEKSYYRAIKGDIAKLNERVCDISQNIVPDHSNTDMNKNMLDTNIISRNETTINSLETQCEVVTGSIEKLNAMEKSKNILWENEEIDSQRVQYEIVKRDKEEKKEYQKDSNPPNYINDIQKNKSKSSWLNALRTLWHK